MACSDDDDIECGCGADEMANEHKALSVAAPVARRDTYDGSNVNTAHVNDSDNCKK